ncbi:MAG: glycosyltransferase family 39 protein [Thermoanaerobaculia bacterium]
MVHPDSQAEPKRWIGIALLGLLLISFALRTWDASQGLNASRYYDERFPLKNVSGLLLHGEFRPRHAFYLSLSYLPQTAVLAASQWLFRVTRYEPFSIYSATSDGYSPTAYWLCRMINVIYGTLSLWVLFLIGRRIYSPEVGLLAAAILAAFGRHVLSSSEFKPDILVIFLVTLTVYWTLGAAFRPSLRRFLLVGVGVGLGVSTKYTGIAGAIPITAAVLTEGRRDRRQWLWLLLAGAASVVTFVALNPFLDVVFEFIPKLVNGYAAKGVEERSDHWVVFERQVRFLIEQHGPIVTVFVALGVAGLVWRIFRPAPGLSPEDSSRERRLGSILVLSLLLGYSALHALGMTLFRGQNYLPVVPFSSLVAAWAIVELWRVLAARLPWLAWRPGAALAGLAVGAALLAQQGTIVYTRVVPTTFERTNDALLAELDPVGLRHVVYERGMGAFDAGGKPRRPLLTPVPRLAALAPDFLDRADVEIFQQRRLQGPDADFYRARVARLPKKQVEIVGDRWFRRRGEPLVILRHPWTLARDPVDLLVRRPEGDPPYLVGRLPAGIARPGEAVSLLLWIPRDSEDREVYELRLDPGGRPVAVFDTGRRLNRRFRTSPRFALNGTELRVRVPSTPDDRPRGYGLEIYAWRPEPAPARP